MPRHQRVNQSIIATLEKNSRLPTEIHTEYTCLSQHTDDACLQKLVDLYTHKDSGRKIDLIVSVDVSATNFIIAHGETRFPNGPVVLLSEKEDMKSVTLKSHRTGQPVDMLLTQAARLPEETIAFCVLTLVDGAGEAFIPKKILPRISQTSNAPLYGLRDAFLGSGIVGGRLSSAELEGFTVAEIGVRMLDGEAPVTFRLPRDRSIRTADSLGFYFGLPRRRLVAAVHLNIGVMREASPPPMIPDLFSDKGIRIFPSDIASGADFTPPGQYFFHLHDRLLSSWSFYANHICLEAIDRS
jgi:hypothetical protein